MVEHLTPSARVAKTVSSIKSSKEGWANRGRGVGEEVPKQRSLGRIVTAGEELPSSPLVNASVTSLISLILVSSESTDESVASPSEEVSRD